jgi:hypothetical protein
MPGVEVSSLELTTRAGTVAPGTCVSELRAQGYRIDCRQEHGPQGRRWFYRLMGRPAPESAGPEGQSNG